MGRTRENRSKTIETKSMGRTRENRSKKYYERQSSLASSSSYSSNDSSFYTADTTDTKTSSLALSEYLGDSQPLYIKLLLGFHALIHDPCVSDRLADVDDRNVESSSYAFQVQPIDIGEGGDSGEGTKQRNVEVDDTTTETSRTEVSRTSSVSQIRRQVKGAGESIGKDEGAETGAESTVGDGTNNDESTYEDRTENDETALDIDERTDNTGTAASAKAKDDSPREEASRRSRTSTPSCGDENNASPTKAYDGKYAINPITTSNIGNHDEKKEEKQEEIVSVAEKPQEKAAPGSVWVAAGGSTKKKSKAKKKWLFGKKSNKRKIETGYEC